MTPTAIENTVDAAGKLWPDADWNNEINITFSDGMRAINISEQQAVAVLREYKRTETRNTKNPSLPELLKRMKAADQSSRPAPPTSRDMTAEQWRRRELDPLAEAYAQGLQSRQFDRACWRLLKQHSSAIGCEWPNPPAWLVAANDRYEQARPKRPIAAK